jgi:hypothetical protein
VRAHPPVYPEIDYLENAMLNAFALHFCLSILLRVEEHAANVVETF